MTIVELLARETSYNPQFLRKLCRIGRLRAARIGSGRPVRGVGSGGRLAPVVGGNQAGPSPQVATILLNTYLVK